MTSRTTASSTSTPSRSTKTTRAKTAAPVDKGSTTRAMNNRASTPARAAPAGRTAPARYQDELDHALADTFPASDPIAPGTAERVARRADAADARSKGKQKTAQHRPSSPTPTMHSQGASGGTTHQLRTAGPSGAILRTAAHHGNARSR